MTTFDFEGSHACKILANCMSLLTGKKDVIIVLVGQLTTVCWLVVARSSMMQWHAMVTKRKLSSENMESIVVNIFSQPIRSNSPYGLFPE